MIDKRLRTLDQNPSVDFFRIGLEHLRLTRGDDGTDTSDLSRAKNKMRVDQVGTAPSVPSFSSVSTGRQNSIDDSLRGDAFKACPDV